MESDAGLTSYELRVKRNIEENQRVLKSLGLLNSAFECKRSIKKTSRKPNVAAKSRSSVKPVDESMTSPALPVRRTRRSSSILKCQGYDEFDEVPEIADEENTPPHKRKKIAAPPVFGPIEGVNVGDWWMTRLECSAAGVHRPTVAGIHGKLDEGCYSIALSGGYEDDIDYGEYFTYTGSGGRDLKGTKSNPKNLRTAPQTKDQVLEGPNAALALNIENHRPVRVIRGYKLPSAYAPEEGYRYDGLYSVERCWTSTGLAGFKVFKYALKRLSDQDPPPWGNNGTDTAPNGIQETDVSVSNNGHESNITALNGFDETVQDQARECDERYSSDQLETQTLKPGFADPLSLAKIMENGQITLASNDIPVTRRGQRRLSELQKLEEMKGKSTGSLDLCQVSSKEEDDNQKPNILESKQKLSYSNILKTKETAECIENSIDAKENPSKCDNEHIKNQQMLQKTSRSSSDFEVVAEDTKNISTFFEDSCEKLVKCGEVKTNEKSEIQENSKKDCLSISQIPVPEMMGGRNTNDIVDKSDVVTTTRISRCISHKNDQETSRDLSTPKGLQTPIKNTSFKNEDKPDILPKRKRLPSTTQHYQQGTKQNEGTLSDSSSPFIQASDKNNEPEEMTKKRKRTSSSSEVCHEGNKQKSRNSTNTLDAAQDGSKYKVECQITRGVETNCRSKKINSGVSELKSNTSITQKMDGNEISINNASIVMGNSFDHGNSQNCKVNEIISNLKNGKNPKSPSFELEPTNIGDSNLKKSPVKSCYVSLTRLKESDYYVNGKTEAQQAPKLINNVKSPESPFGLKPTVIGGYSPGKSPVNNAYVHLTRLKEDNYFANGKMEVQQSTKSNEKKVKFSPEVDVCYLKGKKQVVKQILMSDSESKIGRKLNYPIETNGSAVSQKDKPNKILRTENYESDNKKQTSILKYFGHMKGRENTSNQRIDLRSNRSSIVINEMLLDSECQKNDKVQSTEERLKSSSVTKTVKSKSKSRSPSFKISGTESVATPDLADANLCLSPSSPVKPCWVVFSAVGTSHTSDEMTTEVVDSSEPVESFAGWDWDEDDVGFCGFDVSNVGFCGFDVSNELFHGFEDGIDYLKEFLLMKSVLEKISGLSQLSEEIVIVTAE